jgi:lipid-A-disaccharide synthase
LEQLKSDSIDILIVAAEASSALYACRLLEYWQKSGLKVNAFGIGSRDMEALGFEIIGRSEEMAVVGVVEVVKHYGHIRTVYKKLLELAQQRRPKAVLLLDYPGFNLRLAKDLKQIGLKIVYYISPQIWAWHKSRIHEIRKYVDKMLVVLPFEEEFYRKQNVQVEFVGHPLLDEINPMLFDRAEHKTSREKFGIKSDDFCIGLMPGSRYSELTRHLKVQIETAEVLYEKHPGLKIMLLVAPTFSLAEIKAMLPPTHLPIILCKDEPMQMVSLVDAVLCASGTATLVVGLMKKPMVVMYKMNSFTAFLARHFVKGTAHFGLINLILGGRVVQEFFQGDANPKTMAEELEKIISDRNYYNEMQNKLASSHDLLGRKGATERVARALSEYLA